MIYIVRHGKTSWNNLGKRQGHANIPLNEEGLRQAYAVKEKLKDIKFDYVFSSPLDRALTTAKIITDKDIIVDDRLIERNNGKLEGLVKKEIAKLKRRKDYSDDNYNVESNIKMQERADSFIKELLENYKNKDILIVSHAGIIINLRCALDGVPDSILDYYIDNCEIYTYKN